MELITRKDALAQGLTSYYTGQPCKHGHIARRTVCNGSCMECRKGWTKRWRDAGNSPQLSYNPRGKDLPEVDYLHICFEYLDGKLFWKQRPLSHFKSQRGCNVFNSKYCGKEVGHRHKSNNYIEVRLDGKLYKAHRLIFKMFKGTDPEELIDHIDGNPTNNRIENLRQATQKQNSRNMNPTGKGTSVYKGVCWDKRTNKWIVQITVDDDRRELKRFDTEIEAAEYYDLRAKLLFGEFARVNFN